MKLLEEEMKEKNEEEERKERRRIKEREKKLRRKGKSRENEKRRDDFSLTNQHLTPEVRIEESTVDDEKPDTMSSRNVHFHDEQRIDGPVSKNMHNLSDVSPDENLGTSKDRNGSSGSDHLKYSGRKLKNRYQQDTTIKCSIDGQSAVVNGSGIKDNKSERSYHDNHIDGSSRTTSRLNKHARSSGAKSVIRASGPKLHEKVHCSTRMSDRGDLQSLCCYQPSDYRGKVESCCMTTRAGQKCVCKPHTASLDSSRACKFGNKLTLGDYITDSYGRPKLNFVPKENANASPDVNHMNLQAQGIHLALHSHSMQTDIQDPMQTQPNASVEKTLNFDISQAYEKGFSLFHFGSPFALAAAYKSDSLAAAEGLSLTKRIHHSEGNLTCNTKDSIGKEYNLFASCKGITFSIF